jgi:hypothetical protein
MNLTIDWRAPFELAFELALFLLGSVAVLVVVLVATTLVYGIVKAFFAALRSSASRRSAQIDASRAKHPAGRNLKPVE